LIIRHNLSFNRHVGTDMQLFASAYHRGKPG
jgi:hypothetical protein